MHADPASILLVDDLEANLFALSGLLSGRGWTVTQASSGEEALAVTAEHDFAVILMDLRMPGMDGFETAERIRARDGGRLTPIIFLTASESEAECEQAFCFGAADFIRKPFSPSELQAKVGFFVALYQRNEERYRTLFESIDQGCCLIEMVFDEQGVPVDYLFLEANPAFAQHTGLSDVVGKTVRTLVPDLEPHWARMYGNVALTGVPLRFVEESPSMGRWFDVYAVRMGGAGSPRVAVLFSDITARKRTEQKLLRLTEDLSQADMAKNNFLATLAHELRSPLAPLRNGLEILRQASHDPAQVDHLRQMMERQLGQLVRLVDDLLDLGRITSGKLEVRRERVCVDAIVHSAVEATLPVMRQRGHRLSVQVEDPALELLVDRARLAQVVGNLLTNAAKYTPDGGAIDLSTRREGDALLLSVTDNGIGMQPDALTEVFEMFTQVGEPTGTGDPGLGIGLSLVRRIVEMHGGQVWACSAGPGQGSTFHVRLPLGRGALPAEVPEPREASGASTLQPPPPARRVLVVDDNVDSAETLSMLLTLEGQLTRTAHDGPGALQAYLDFQPDVVFLDIGLPGKSGYEVATEIRQLPGGQAVVLAALTGWGADADRARSREAGFDHHFRKPAELSEVLAVLAQPRSV